MGVDQNGLVVWEAGLAYWVSLRLPDSASSDIVLAQ